MSDVRRETGVGWPEESEAAVAAAEPAPASEGETTTAPAPAPADRRRSARSGALVGVLLALLGFAVVVQVRATADDPQLDAARQEDLVRILDDLDERQDRLRDEIQSLEDRKRQLTSGAQSKDAALAEARRRGDELGILAGTLAAEGPGLEVRFQPGDERIKAATILDAVEELRGAGAEAMQIQGSDGTAVRIVASTYFLDAGEGIDVDGQRLSAPYTILAIGDPQTMRAALHIPGGVVDVVQKDGGTVVVHEPGTVRVSALRRANPPKYARPAE